MAIITVSRQWYSLGDEIARTVADDIGYDFIDKRKIGEALAILGLPASEMERFDEKKPSIWESLALQHNRFACLMKAAIYDFAAKNDTLILGRGAQVLLKDMPGTLHTRIIAPFKVRLKRLIAHEGCDEKTGERVLRQSDRDSSGYIRSFFGADWDDPDYYDVLINTRTLSTATATGMLLHAIKSAALESDPAERSSRLTALALQHKAEAAIMDVQRGSKIYVAVTNVEQGIVTLRGTSDSEAVKTNCGLAISGIQGVRGVQNEIAVTKAVYT